MGFFDEPSGVEQYIQMTEGYNGAELMEALAEFLPQGATVLELGMGPGRDLQLLAQRYQVTGSDASQVFVDRYRATHPDADLMLLDAVTLTMASPRTFDCLFSNKVLHHLPRADLVRSLSNQQALLNPDGILFHSFWRGSKEERHHGLLFVYYQEPELAELFAGYDLLRIERYKEDEAEDSILVAARRR